MNSTMAKNKRQVTEGRARERGVVRLVSFECPVEIDDAMERVRHKQDRTKKSLILMAIRRLLADEGELPPTPKQTE